MSGAAGQSLTPAVTYAVQRSPDGQNFTTIANGLYGAFWQDETPIWPTASGQNWYRIVSSDGIWSTTGPSVAVNVNGNPPPVPVLSQPGGTISVLATWAYQGFLVTGYALQRSADNLNWTTIASGGNTFLSYTDATVAAWTRQYYRIMTTTSNGTVTGQGASIAITSAAVPGAGYRIVINGQDLSALMIRTPGPKIHRQVGHQRGQATIPLAYEGQPPALKEWQSVLVWDGASLIFSGWITDYALAVTSPSRQDAQVTAHDASGFISAVMVDEQFEGISAGYVIKNMIARYCPMLTVNNVAKGPIMPYMVFSRVTLDQAIQRVLVHAAAQTQEASFQIDANLDCHLSFSGSLPNAPVTLSDSDAATGVYGR